MLKNQLKFIVTITLVLGLSISFQSLLASWQAPTAVPPTVNVDIPINTGSGTQEKTGSLRIAGEFRIASDIIMLGLSTDSPQIMFYSDSTTYSYIDNNNGDLRFVNNYSGELVRMIVKENGYVGVGSNNPTQRLDVNGKIRMRTQTALGDSDDIVTTKGYVDTNDDVLSEAQVDSFVSNNGYITGVTAGVGIKDGGTSGDITVAFDCSEVEGDGISCSGESLYVTDSYRGAENRCGNNLFLDGDGDCRTASQIVSDGGGDVPGCSWEGWKCSCSDDSVGTYEGLVIVGIQCLSGTVNDIKASNFKVSSSNENCSNTAPSWCNAGYTHD